MCTPTLHVHLDTHVHAHKCAHSNTHVHVPAFCPFLAQIPQVTQLCVFSDMSLFTLFLSSAQMFFILSLCYAVFYEFGLQFVFCGHSQWGFLLSALFLQH